MHQFSDVSDPKKVNVKPDRLRIKTTKKTGTVGNTLHSPCIPHREQKQIAHPNGMDLIERVSADILVKAIEKGDSFEK
jgi:hypothetical protein